MSQYKISPLFKELTMRIEDLNGFISFPSGFQILKNQPIDARYVGEDLEFLDSVVEIDAAYPGLRIFIVSENKTYVYKKDSEGNYKFQLETVSFTQAEESALRSGITKEKVKEFEGKYKAPSTGIPESDLSESVKGDLQKARKALQEETDPTVPSWAKQPAKPSYSIEEIRGLKEALADKVAKEEGKGLSDQNFTLENKEKLAGISEGAQVNKIEEIFVNGEKQPISNDKVVDLRLKTLNKKSLVGEGDVSVVETDSDQSINGFKTFTKEISVPPKSGINLKNPDPRSVATEAQLKKAIESLGNILTIDSPIPAGNLSGEIPSTVKFPVLNQDTTGNSGSATKLRDKRSFGITGKVRSNRVDFNGEGDVIIEVTELSPRAADYPVLNQDTTGNAGSADKLKTPRKLKVNLGKSNETALFDGSYDQEEIPVKGRLSPSNFMQGKGTGTSRKVLGTSITVEDGDLSLIELTPADVGLGNLTNEKQATESQLNVLAQKISKLENFGNFVGSYNTYESLPANVETILLRYGVEPGVSDFATVRGGDYGDSGIPRDSVTCWSITKIDENGNIEWAYEYTYNLDISGKVDKVSSSRKGNIPRITEDGNLEDSGKSLDNLVIGDDPTGDGSGLNYREKIKQALISSGTIAKAYRLVHPGTSDLCNHGSNHKPVYFKEGTPVECENIAAISEEEGKEGYVVSASGGDLKIYRADKAGLSDKAVLITDEEGNPETRGSQNLPVYLDGGKLHQLPAALGDLAFEGVTISNKDDLLKLPYDDIPGSFKVIYRKNEDPGDSSTAPAPGKFEIAFVANLYSNTSKYFLICPKTTQGDSGSEPFDPTNLKTIVVDYLNTGYGSAGLTPDDIAVVDPGSRDPESGLVVHTIGVGGENGHGIDGCIPRVRVFEIEGDIRNEASTDSVTIFENTGMARIRFNGNIEILSNSEPYYNKANYSINLSALQGVYLVEVSK